MADWYTKAEVDALLLSLHTNLENTINMAIGRMDALEFTVSTFDERLHEVERKTLLLEQKVYGDHEPRIAALEARVPPVVDVWGEWNATADDNLSA